MEENQLKNNENAVNLKTPTSAIVSLVFGIISAFAYFLVFPPLVAVIAGIVALANLIRKNIRIRGLLPGDLY